MHEHETARNKQVVWISGEPWDQDGGTHRAMAIALSAYARILWVDPPTSPVTRNKKKRIIKPVLFEATDRIACLRPVVLPRFSRLGVRATTPTLMRAQVRWAVRKLGFRPSAVVMLYLGGLLGRWGDGITNVMFGTDDYVAGAHLMGLSARHLRKRERQALSKADVVVAISDYLARRWSDMQAKPIVIPNGCWPLAEATDRPSAEEADLARPMAGLVGR